MAVRTGDGLKYFRDEEDSERYGAWSGSLAKRAGTSDNTDILPLRPVMSSAFSHDHLYILRQSDVDPFLPSHSAAHKHPKEDSKKSESMQQAVQRNMKV